MNKVRNEKEVVTTDNTEMQRTMRPYEQIQDKQKMDRRNGQILRKVQFSNIESGKIEIMNKTIASIEIETVIKNILKNIKKKKKSPGPEGFTGEFNQAFR